MTPAIPADSEYRTRLIGFLAIVVGCFMAVLDVQIVASSINELQAGLLASADEIQWVQTGYLIAEVIGIPLSALLSRAFSTRWYFVICALGFAASSLGCAFAWDLNSMVFFRALQGFLGAGMIPLMFSTILLLFPADRQMAPLVIAGMTTTLAPALGPSIGGYITNIASWHWLFLINLPPALLSSSVVLKTLRIDEPEMRVLKDVDLLSVLGMIGMLGGLEFLLEEGPRRDWFSNDLVTYSLFTATCGTLVFFWRSVTAEHPVIQLKAFHDRNFAVGSLMVFIIGINVYVMAFLTPMFLGQVRGFTPLDIGKVMGVQGLALFLSAPLGAMLFKRVGARRMMTGGLLIMAIGTWLATHVTAEWGLGEFVLALLLNGAGTLFATLPLNHSSLATLRADDIKDASGIFNLMRNIGGAIGLALLVSAMNHQTWLHWQNLAETIRPTRWAVHEQLLALQTLLQPRLGSGSQGAALGMIASELQHQVTVMAFADMYWLLAMSLFAMTPLVLLLREPLRESNNLPLH